MAKRISESYTLTAKLFHWIVGVLVLVMIGVGLYMTSIPMGPDKIRLIGLHKATGAVILVLMILRGAWRLSHAAPLLPEDLPPFYRYGARLAHFALYAILILMPLSGWVMSSAAGFPVSVFGLFTLPSIASPDKHLAELMVTAHNTMAWTLIALLTLHVLAALWHHFVRKDSVLRSMWFSRP